MELRVTVNVDKRYYLDEGLAQHADSLLHDLSLFGSMKADLYEQLYK